MKISVRLLIIAALLCGAFFLLCGISSCKNSISGKVKGDAVHGVVMELSGDASLIIKTSVNGKYKFKAWKKAGIPLRQVKKGTCSFQEAGVCWLMRIRLELILPPVLVWILFPAHL
jgi:hypothetical protein